MWFWKIMVRFFMSLDTTLFNFIGTLYDLLIAISRTSILTQGDIAQFAQRIELLLGIFMLFKLSFSLITYIVNPDDFSDKQKGFGKLIQSAVISLLMLVLVPYIFQMAFNLQAKILNDNLLAKLLLGEKLMPSDSCSDGYYYDDEENVCKNTTTGETVENYSPSIIDTAGNSMAFQLMLPFFSPKYSLGELYNCISLYDEDGTFSDSCSDALKATGLSDQDQLNYTKGIENESLGLTFRTSIALATTSEYDNEEQFIIDYKYPLSTVVAVVVCLLLVTFCIDIGVRSVKLAFLQLIYPIPVISYMDPKSGKDGIFKKWYQMCFSTYLSLFMRLLALYFGIYIITKVANLGMYDIINGSQVTNGWVQIFIIIGVLMFVKQLPKILENMGIKLDGDGKFTLNPLKKLEEGAIGGKMLKKPNEMIRKLPMAPLHGAGTVGKKFIGGIDAARNGKGFMQGFKRTHGNLYNAYHKKLDEWAPDSAEARKNERLGRENIHQLDKRQKDGKKYYNQVQKLKENGNKDGIRNLFKNQEYKDSHRKVEQTKADFYAAKNSAQLTASRLGNVKTVNDLTASDKTAFDKFTSESGWNDRWNDLNKAINDAKDKKTLDALAEEEIKLREEGDKLLDQFVNKQIADANANAGKKESIYNLANDRHKEYKKVYQEDAQIEDAYDFYDKMVNHK